MAEPLRLEMASTSQKPSRFFSRRFFPVLALAGVFALSALVGWWLGGGRVSSVSATVDAWLYPVSSEFSARLEEISAREGDRVTAHQALGRVDASAYNRQLREAGKDVGALRTPGMEETAERIRAAQKAEKDIVERLAQARNEEEGRRRVREERVMEHVRAQLALRSLDSQGGERPVGKSRYEAARQAEVQARVRMEAAGGDFELFSRMRAAAEQELRRVREEVQSAREGKNGVNRVAADVDGTLYAPVGGTVLRTSAVPGQMIRRGEPVLLILPDGKEAENAYRVMAYFPLDVRDSLSVGQPCEVRLDGEEEVVQGEVVELMTPQSLPADLSDGGGTPYLSGNSDSVGVHLFVPVHIRLKDWTKPALRPGRRANCVVRTRSLLGFRGF